jgi:hypothetical protein
MSYMKSHQFAHHPQAPHYPAACAGLLQEARAALAAAQGAAERARGAAAKHQAAVAALTGDNLVLLLRVRGAEDAAGALRAERDALKTSLEEQKGPWFEEVREDPCQWSALAALVSSCERYPSCSAWSSQGDTDSCRIPGQCGSGA